MSSTRNIVAKAPGKVILHGEYAVVFDKHAIATTVGLYTTVEATIVPNCSTITLNLESFQTKYEWPLTKLQTCILPDSSNSVVIEMSNDVRDILNHLTDGCDGTEDSKNSAKAFLFLLVGISQVYGSPKENSINVSVSSEFPVGACLGSCAAFSVALTGALFVALGHNVEEKQLVSDWAYQCERLFHGKPSGIDNSICSFGGTLLFKQGKLVEKLETLPNLNVLLVYTNVQRNTKVLVGNLINRKETFPCVINNIMEAIDNISQSAWAAYRSKTIDDKNIKTLAEMNHHLLNSIGAGHESIETVSRIAKNFGAVTKLTGAGGGGCI